MYEKTLKKLFAWSGKKLNKLNGGYSHNKKGQKVTRRKK